MKLIWIIFVHFLFIQLPHVMLLIIKQPESYCRCTNVWSPVCGSNYKTYPSKCKIDCASRTKYGQYIKLRMIYKGACGNRHRSTPT